MTAARVQIADFVNATLYPQAPAPPSPSPEEDDGGTDKTTITLAVLLAVMTVATTGLLFDKFRNGRMTRAKEGSKEQGLLPQAMEKGSSRNVV